MKLDSEKQRRLLLNLIGKVPVQTNIGELLNGIDPEIMELIRSIKEAEIQDAD